MSHRFVSGWAHGPYLPALSYLKDTHSTRIDTIQKLNMIIIMSCLPPPAGACSVQTFFVSLAVRCDSCSVGGNLTHVSLLTML